MPPIYLNGYGYNGIVLKQVQTFKYLGHIVTSDLRDEEDTERAQASGGES